MILLTVAFIRTVKSHHNETILSYYYEAIALGIISYSMVTFIMPVVEGLKEHYPRNYGVWSHTPAGITFDAFNALGTVAFSFVGHNVVSEIQATLPSTDENPSKVPMWQGVVVAYFIVIFCYMTVAVTGFWAFGNVVEDDVQCFQI
ncbi:hypothetical protein VNO80_16001 [Phaseolus coccineus]|uniref:Amino acid transporter transmembrane domain-containing protein n=1 Tax=Phaseolus coccineus TaxID=3886 RepID=A0AAN9MMP2_PHACN